MPPPPPPYILSLATALRLERDNILFRNMQGAVYPLRKDKTQADIAITFAHFFKSNPKQF